MGDVEQQKPSKRRFNFRRDWLASTVWGCVTAMLIIILGPFILFNAYNLDHYWDANSGRMEIRHTVFGYVTKTEPRASALGELYLEYVGPYPDEAEWHFDTSYFGLPWMAKTGGHSKFAKVVNAGRWLSQKVKESTTLDDETKRWLILIFLEAARTLEIDDTLLYGNQLAHNINRYEAEGRHDVTPDDFPTPTEYIAGRPW